MFWTNTLKNVYLFYYVDTKGKYSEEQVKMNVYLLHYLDDWIESDKTKIKNTLQGRDAQCINMIQLQ